MFSLPSRVWAMLLRARHKGTTPPSSPTSPAAPAPTTATPTPAGRVGPDAPAVKSIYEQQDYLEAYAAHTDLRVQQDPHKAIGGRWEEIGQLQFDFLLARGLAPHHTLLDIGCGTLRGGRHFIRHLDPGHYTGFDISAKALEYGQSLVKEEGLEDKQPRLVLSRNKDLTLREFAGSRFDYILAQSVFTHLKPEHIEQCLAHVGQVMAATSTFYFTYHKTAEVTQKTVKDFRYPRSFFEELAERHGFDLEDCSAQYGHPRDQQMLSIRKRQPGA